MRFENLQKKQVKKKKVQEVKKGDENGGAKRERRL